MGSRRTRWVVAVAAVMASFAGVLGTGALPAGAEPGGIVLSELNYHAGSDLDTDDFLELTNTSAAAIDMSGWSFSSGVTAVFPTGTVVPGGGRFVVAKDAAQFQVTYGFAPDFVYGGNLSNGGEAVTLVDTALAVVDSVTYADLDPWPATPDGTGPSLELRDLAADNLLPESWGASLAAGGTPRAVNSINGTGAAPVVTNLTATPARPNPNQAVVVSARLRVGSTATLTYKIMFAADVAVPMLDDAASPGGAGDGVYAATIPGQAAGRLIRYRVDASSNGTAYALPIVGDSIRYRGVVVLNPAVNSQLPTIEWFMADAVYNDILANHRFDDFQGAAVWTYNGQVWDNALMNVRGNSSRTNAKVNWKVELPKGYEFDLGGQLPYPLDEFALQAYAPNFADVAWQTVKDAGARGLNIIPVRTQRNGNFWSLSRIMETMDGSWRDDKGVDDWAIYKGDGGSLRRTASVAELQNNLWLDKKTREDEDQTDAWTFSNNIDAPASAAQLAWIYRNVNVPEMINYLAITTIIRHHDSGWYNWWLARDTEGTGRWELWHWDLDWTFTNANSDDDGLFLTPVSTGNRFYSAMLNHPVFQQMYYRRLRTLADQFLAPGSYEAKWDAITARTQADWNLDRAMWGGYTPASARTTFLAGLADRRNAINNNTGAGRPVPTSQSATASVTIGDVTGPSSAGGASFSLFNSGSTAVDVSKWTVPAVGLTIPSGTVVPAGQRVYFVANDVAFTAASTANRLVAKEFRVALADAGATLTLLDGARTVSSVANPFGTGGPTTTSTTTTTAPTTTTTSTTTTTTTTTTTAPPSGTLFAESFPGATGAAWPAAWTGTSANGSVQQNAGAGRLTFNNTTGAFARAQLSGLASRADSSTLLSYQWGSTGSSGYFSVFARGSGGWTNSYRPVNGYGLEFSSSSSTVTVKRVSNGSATNLRSVSGANTVSTAKQWLRLRVVGSTIQFKTWVDGQTEPTTWRSTDTDTTVTAPGQLFLSYNRGSSNTAARYVAIDDVAVTTG